MGHFLERENYVDRRMVLTIASHLQTEPNPQLKDQILRQMIDVLCVDETWKRLVPQRPQRKQQRLGDALIDFIDSEIHENGTPTDQSNPAENAGPPPLGG